MSCLIAAGSCAGQQPTTTAPAGDLQLPPGFRATVFADNLGNGRHIIVRENGDVYVSLGRRNQARGGGIVALRDDNADGTAEQVRYFGEVSGTGLDLRDGHVYFVESTRVVRFKFAGDDELVPSGPMEVVVAGLPGGGGHDAKPVTFDRDGKLYVNIGCPSNACQEPDRTPGVQGRQPCPELEGRGIYQYDASKVNQRHPQDGVHFATGLRQTVALEWNTHAGQLCLVMHGRDQLNSLFPQYYSEQDSAELPAEELHLVTRGLDAGWPYTYWDQRRNARMVAPEYGGDGRKAAEPGKYAAPAVAFPGHWAPNDLVFYDAARWGGSWPVQGANASAKSGSTRPASAKPFPARYLHGAFIAFHGSWNRSPLPQQGFKVVFQPFSDGRPAGKYEDFATGFAGQEPVRSAGQAKHRPCGVAVAPDGALFVVDSVRGRVWRITYEG